MKSKYGNFLIGLMIMLVTIIIVFSQISNENAQLTSLGLLTFSISIMFLSLGYLHSQYKNKDERMRMIREKGMYFSYFTIMVYYLIFIILIGTNIITITAFSAVQILGSLTIITVFLSQVILSKIY